MAAPLPHKQASVESSWPFCSKSSWFLAIFSKSAWFLAIFRRLARCQMAVDVGYPLCPQNRPHLWLLPVSNCNLCTEFALHMVWTLVQALTFVWFAHVYVLCKYTQLVWFVQLHWACMICTSKLSLHDLYNYTLHDAQKFTPLVAPACQHVPTWCKLCFMNSEQCVDKFGNFTVQSRYIYEHNILNARAHFLILKCISNTIVNTLFSLHCVWYLKTH